MPTQWEQLKKILRAELKAELANISDDAQNDLIVFAIREYSVADPLLKMATITVTAEETDYALPLDYIHLDALMSGTARILGKRFAIDWFAGRATESGSYVTRGRQTLRLLDPAAGTLTLWYWGFHADDGSTLTWFDVERVGMLLKARAWGAREEQILAVGGGRFQAGPVSWDVSASARVFGVKREFWEREYAGNVRKRAYGTRSGGRDVNVRERVVTGSGEILT